MINKLPSFLTALRVHFTITIHTTKVRIFHLIASSLIFLFANRPRNMTSLTSPITWYYGGVEPTAALQSKLADFTKKNNADALENIRNLPGTYHPTTWDEAESFIAEEKLKDPAQRDLMQRMVFIRLMTLDGPGKVYIASFVHKIVIPLPVVGTCLSFHYKPRDADLQLDCL